ncbi:heavy metal-associated isoprenylated plant protein 45-like [Tripterygium wilfordii]|uniref:heavy metal-associated isoprenylated plant protein 45-like n=1 Tax=Tripterygium wilfordii TaxID=458696 RepID=UPI0018F833B3|nr:heavy metal-associated isoprenylated plant protein 45-like [Tripterygium wilfordii]
MEVVELKVNMHCKCNACAKIVRKTLCKIKGVKGVEIDTILNKITVLGYMNRKDVVKAVRRTGRRAEAWPSTCGVEAPSPRLPRGFRCIIPRCIVSKS